LTNPVYCLGRGSGVLATLDKLFRHNTSRVLIISRIQVGIKSLSARGSTHYVHGRHHVSSTRHTRRWIQWCASRRRKRARRSKLVARKASVRTPVEAACFCIVHVIRQTYKLCHTSAVKTSASVLNLTQHLVSSFTHRLGFYWFLAVCHTYTKSHTKPLSLQVPTALHHGRNSKHHGFYGRSHRNDSSLT